MNQADRAAIYTKIEQERTTKVIAFITGERVGLETQIAEDAVAPFVSILDKIGPTPRLSLILETNGGHTSAAWRIIQLIRSFCGELEVIIPSKARSSGTLMSLGANKIVMTKQATLGPIDPSITGNLLAPEVKNKGDLAELRDRLAGELEDRAIYSIEVHKSELLKMGAEPFGAAVAARFGNTSEDISEAAHCLAMARNTAAVFHLMRVMEIAVKALGEMLQCTVMDKNDKDLEWGKILGNIGDKVAEMPKGHKKDEWSSVVTLLYHVKQAWRNRTMHPKQTYTDTEALAAFNAVRSFMTELAALETS